MLDHHLETAKVWYPHEFVPWENAENVDLSPGGTWRPDQYPLEEGIRSAIYVNLLTEDNLPYYSHTLLSNAPPGHPLNEWTRRWVAEEWRHSAVIRDWVLVTGAIDPVKLEDARMIQMGGGEVPQPDSIVELLAYTTLQELATNVAHRNTGRQLGGPEELNGKLVMNTVAGDERRHHEFYRGLAKAAFEIDPSTMMIALQKQLRGFEMPGTGIPDFELHSVNIALAGIFGATEYRNSVVVPTLEKLEVFEIGGLTDAGKRAQAKIDRLLKALDRLSTMETERIEEARAAIATQ